MIEIAWRDEASDDLIEIWTYIAEDNPAAADRHIDRLRAATARLIEFPDSGHQRDDLDPALRVINVGRYLIVYRHDDGRVEIVAVRHGSRLMPGRDDGI